MQAHRTDERAQRRLDEALTVFRHAVHRALMIGASFQEVDPALREAREAHR
jgi:hypothetical protein